MLSPPRSPGSLRSSAAQSSVQRRATAAHVQTKLTRPFLSELCTSFRQLIKDDSVAAARHSSSSGFLGTAWLLAPGFGPAKLSSDSVRLEGLLCCLLGLPLPDVAAGVHICNPEAGGCNKAVLRPPESALQHADSHGQLTTRSNDFLRGLDFVYAALPPGVDHHIIISDEPGAVTDRGRPDCLT